MKSRLEDGERSRVVKAAATCTGRPTYITVFHFAIGINGEGPSLGTTSDMGDNLQCQMYPVRRSGTAHEEKSYLL